MTFNNPSNSSNNDFQQTSGVFEFADRVRLSQGWVENLQMFYTSPTFTISGADGTALSATNPAYIVMRSATGVKLIKYKIIANQSFDDDSGTSDIAGNLFGTTTSVAWANTMPMFVYAVGNDDEDTIQFMLCRRPKIIISPAVANIGAPDDAVADIEKSFWSLSNIDETLYDANPCLCVGSFGIQKSAADDWTVQALDSGGAGATDDGIGRFNSSTQFTFPAAQNGASASTHMIANGGTAPVFGTEFVTYMISKDGHCEMRISLRNDGGTDGAGAVSTRMAIPFQARGGSVDPQGWYGSCILQGGGGSFDNVSIVTYNNTNTSEFSILGAAVQNSRFTNAARSIIGAMTYPL